MPVQDQIGDGLGIFGRTEDFLFVLTQQLQAHRQTGGVLVQIVLATEFGVEKGAGQFGAPRSKENGRFSRRSCPVQWRSS